MRGELQQYEQIDRYLNNQLTEEELSIFKQRMERDHTFRQEVDDHRLLHEMVFDHGLLELRKKLRAFGRPPARGNGFVKWGAAIVVIGIMSVFVFYQFTGDNQKTPEATRPVNQKKVEERPTSSPIQPQPQDHKTGEKPGAKQRQSAAKQIQRDKSTQTDTITSTGITPPQRKENLKTEQPAKPTDTLSSNTPQTRETIPSHTSEASCDLHLSEIIITTVESCYNTPGGKIIIDERSALKGIAPFAFSIDGSYYSDEYSFTGLYPGWYQLTVTDANGCHWTYNQDIRVSEKDCMSSEYSIYPAHGEVWKIPVDDTTNGHIEIYNNTGALVFSAVIINGFPNTWDGTSNGKPLTTGSYSYILKSANKILTGTVTIIR